MKQSKNALRADALSISLIGTEAHLVRIESTITPTPDSFEITGLSEAYQRETRIRRRRSSHATSLNLRVGWCPG
jgi:magnesium chelatase family protein